MLKALLGDPNARKLKKYQPLVLTFQEVRRDEDKNVKRLPVGFSLICSFKNVKFLTNK